MPDVPCLRMIAYLINRYEDLCHPPHSRVCSTCCPRTRTFPCKTDMCRAVYRHQIHNRNCRISNWPWNYLLKSTATRRAGGLDFRPQAGKTKARQCFIVALVTGCFTPGLRQQSSPPNESLQQAIQLCALTRFPVTMQITILTGGDGSCIHLKSCLRCITGV